MADIFELRESFEWRGLASLLQRLRLKPAYAEFDAEQRFAMRMYKGGQSGLRMRRHSAGREGADGLQAVWTVARRYPDGIVHGFLGGGVRCPLDLWRFAITPGEPHDVHRLCAPPRLKNGLVDLSHAPAPAMAQLISASSTKRSAIHG